MNETFKIVCCICYMDNKENHTQKHYRCKAEIFFPPQLYFFTQLQKVVFFNVSRTFNSDAKLGPRLGALWTQNKVRLIFLRFYQKVFNDGTTFSFCFLNCTTVPLYYILRIKLWYCSDAVVPSWSCVQAFIVHRPRGLRPRGLRLGQSFSLQTGEAWGQLPERPQVVQLELWIKPSQTALEGPEYGSPPAVPHLTWQVQWSCWEKRQISPQIRLWNVCDVTPQKPSSDICQPLCHLLVRVGITGARLGCSPVWHQGAARLCRWWRKSPPAPLIHHWLTVKSQPSFCLNCCHFLGLWCFLSTKRFM